MPRALWPLLQDRPAIQVILTQVQTGQPLARMLLADTGAGRANSRFDLILDEDDCVLAGGVIVSGVDLSGAYNGNFTRYMVRIRVPMLGFDRLLPVVAVPEVSNDLDGIACFAFLNRFTYSNFGNPTLFGLET